jgi:predicted HAD superfamily Cof-like phosphohydrolase
LGQRFRFCTAHWAEYAPYAGEPWFRELINSTERERYYQQHIAPRFTSLDALTARGEVVYDRMTPYRTAPTKKRVRKRAQAEETEVLDGRAMVEACHVAFEQFVGPGEPGPQWCRELSLGTQLLIDEYMEMLQAFEALKRNVLAANAPRVPVAALVPLVQEIADSIYVGYGFLVRLGAPAWPIVPVLSPTMTCTRMAAGTALWSLQSALHSVRSHFVVWGTSWAEQLPRLTQGQAPSNDLLTSVTNAYIAELWAVGRVMGLDLRPVFRAVHDANMRKLVDGQPLKRADGKFLKPQGWVGPQADLLAVLWGQHRHAEEARNG